VATGNEVVVTASGAATAKLRTLVAVSELVSETCTVKLFGPALVGIPEITPVLEVSVSPAGSDPAEMDQE
jgi:hypothetical protein